LIVGVLLFVVDSLFLSGLLELRSVNPISTRGSRLCPPHYFLPPIFSNLPTALSLLLI
jgi:hypothetical protein